MHDTHAWCRTILGLLSVLKNTARKGTVLAEVGANGAAADDGVAGLTTTLRAWQLSAPWLTAAPHASCVRSRCRPSCSDPGAPPLFAPAVCKHRLRLWSGRRVLIQRAPCSELLSRRAASRPMPCPDTRGTGIATG